MKISSIKELKDKVDAGEIEESKLTIVLDNDCTEFYDGAIEEDETGKILNEIEVMEPGGYVSIESVYKVLFPNAIVTWC